MQTPIKSKFVVWNDRKKVFYGEYAIWDDGFNEVNEFLHTNHFKVINTINDAPDQFWRMTTIYVEE